MTHYEGIYIGSNNKVAGYDIRYSNEKRPLIIFCHGFKGFKDWGTFNLIADYFVEAGYHFAKLNFSHNGTSVDSPVDFVDLEAFGNNNFERELFDIDALLQQLKTESFSAHLDLENLLLIGHSRGGATALTYTLQNKFVKKCATLAAVINVVKRYGNSKDKRWKEEGVKYVLNGRTKQSMPIYYQLTENTQKLKSILNIQENLKTDERTFLLVHGTNDEAVLPNEIDTVKNLKNVNTFLIDGANHVFGGSHPYLDKKIPKETEVALGRILEYFNS